MAVLKTPDYEISVVKSSIGQLNFNLALSDIPDQWTKTMGEGIKVAVLDSGLPNHRDLDGKIAASKNFTSDKDIADKEGHCTSVAGIIAAEMKNDTGVTGIAPRCQLYIGKVLSDDGIGKDSALANGIRWAVDQGCHIINMSVGAPAAAEKKFKQTKAAVEYANSKGVFMFAAAGNDGSKKIDIPARWNSVIAIVAIDKEKQVAHFSNSGPEVDFSALGVNVISTYLDQQYAAVSGTSFASPGASAIAALILSEDKKAENKIKDFWDMRANLIKLSTSLGDAPWNESYGFGNITFNRPDNLVDTYNRVYGIVEEPPVQKAWWENLLFWR